MHSLIIKQLATRYNHLSVMNRIYCANSSADIDSERRKKMIEIELQMLREEGEYFVPNKLIDKNWTELLKLKERSQRMNFYKFLKKREIGLEITKRRKEENETKFERRIAQHDENPHIAYGLSRNCMFFRIRRQVIDRFYNANLAHSVMHGEKLVLDLGYHENMNEAEVSHCVRQIRNLYIENKVNRDPFDLYFCNLQGRTKFDDKVCKAVGNLRTNKCLVSVSAKSYLEIFPKHKLVYLTPDCRDDLNEFDYDDVYVVGGFVELGTRVPLSLAKAKKEGVRMARLPLAKYIGRSWASRSLGLDQVVKILLTAKNTRSWDTAFLPILHEQMQQH